MRTQQGLLTDYWEGKSLQTGSLLNSRYEKNVMRLLTATKGVRNLEIGCGTARWAAAFEGSEYIGVEIDKRAAVYAHKKTGKAIIIADTRKLPFKDQVFDYVFSIGVVEHFPETSLAVREHLRVSTLNGLILISVPNLISPFIIPSILRSIFRGYDGRSYQKKFGNRYTHHRFERVLIECSAKIVHYDVSGTALPLRLEGWLGSTDSKWGNEIFFTVRRG